MIYIIKREAWYQSKVNSNLVFSFNLVLAVHRSFEFSLRYSFPSIFL